MSRHPVYHDPRWKVIRQLVLERDGFECQLRLTPRCKGRANAVDHRVGLADGGDPFDPSNLRASCMSCNTTKRNRDNADRAREARGLPPKWRPAPVRTPTPVVNTGTGPTPPYRQKPNLSMDSTCAEVLDSTGYDWPCFREGPTHCRGGTHR